jgi:hypothetical protein
MVEAGLEWLYTYNPDLTDGRDVVMEIIRAALATQPQSCRAEAKSAHIYASR